MMSWWRVLEAASFVLHHVANILDLIVEKYNPIEESESLAGKLWYLSDVDHIIRIFKGLGLSNDEDLKIADRYLKQGEFKIGIAKLYMLEEKLAITLDKQFLLPIIQSFATPNINILSSDHAYKFRKCIDSTFPIAFPRYCSRLPDVMSRIDAMKMNPVEKYDLLVFLQCLQYLEPDNQLDTGALARNASCQSFIIDHDVIDENESSSRLFSKFYVTYKPSKDKNWGGISLCIPMRNVSKIPTIADLYSLPKSEATMKDFLVSKERHTWIRMDPNLNHDAIFNSILNGNLTKFRRMLSILEKHLKETHKLDYEFSDLTLPDDCIELIRLGKKFGGRGLEDYLDRLRLYCMAYAITSAGTWRDKINHCGLHKRLSWGDVIQDPRDGTRINRRNDYNEADDGSSSQNQGQRSYVPYPRIPSAPSLESYSNWGN